MGGGRHIWRRLIADRAGASAVLTILMLPVLLGFTALAIDGGMAYASRRHMQDAADSAAFSTAAAAANGFSNLNTQARAVAKEYGFEHGKDGVAVQAYSPASTGPHAGEAKSVEVVITRPMLTFFSSLLGGATGTIRGRAVAISGKVGDTCMLVLDPTATWATLINGSPQIDLNDCALQVNSTAAQAMLINGSPIFSAKAVRLGGGLLQNGFPTLNIGEGVTTGQEALEDPYSSKAAPTGGCTYTGYPAINGSSNYTLPAPSGTATYCGGLTINASGSPTITFRPGVYVFTGNLLINGTPKIVGDGVTFVFTGSANLTINGAAELHLTAPTTGATAGMVFFSPSTAAGGDVILNGSNKSDIKGGMYFPTKKVTINGSNGVAGDCLQLVTRTILFNGSGRFGVNCGTFPAGPIGGAPSRLVE